MSCASLAGQSQRYEQGLLRIFGPCPGVGTQAAQDTFQGLKCVLCVVAKASHDTNRACFVCLAPSQRQNHNGQTSRLDVCSLRARDQKNDRNGASIVSLALPKDRGAQDTIQGFKRVFCVTGRASTRTWGTHDTSQNPKCTCAHPTPPARTNTMIRTRPASYLGPPSRDRGAYKTHFKARNVS